MSISVNYFLTKFEGKKDMAENAADILLTPLRTISGYTLVTADGISKNVTIEKTQRVSAFVFSVLLYPITIFATLTGMCLLLCSKSHQEYFKNIFKTDTAPVDEETFEVMERVFWEEVFENKDLVSLMELLIRDHIEDIEAQNREVLDKLGNLMIEKYKKANEKFKLSNVMKKALLGSISKQLYILHLPKKHETPYYEIKVPQSELTPAGKLRVFETVGDGSCGFHALLGEAQDSVYQCDAKPIREQFCKNIREKFAAGALPNQIENVLKLYFDDYPDVVPGFFNKPALIKIFRELRENYRSLSIEEKNRRIDQFLKNEQILNAYLANMAKVDTYLTQDELEAAAICFNKTVRLYQPGWGSDDSMGISELNPGHEVVEIFYNGINHYEKAMFFNVG